MKRRFRITKAEVGSWHTDFSITDLDHENSKNLMSPAALIHHLGGLAGKSLGSIKGFEFTVELPGVKEVKGFDPLSLCGKTIKGNSSCKKIEKES